MTDQFTIQEFVELLKYCPFCQKQMIYQLKSPDGQSILIAHHSNKQIDFKYALGNEIIMSLNKNSGKINFITEVAQNVFHFYCFCDNCRDNQDSIGEYTAQSTEFILDRKNKTFHPFSFLQETIFLNKMMLSSQYECPQSTLFKQDNLYNRYEAIASKLPLIKLYQLQDSNQIINKIRLLQTFG